MRLPSIRISFFIAFLISCGLLGFAAYLQFALNLKPCVLCVMQRFCFIGVAIIFFLASIHKTKSWGHKIYCLLAFIICGFGLYFGGRHMWLQHLPPSKVGSCGPGFNYLINNLPLSESIKILFLGSGDCGKVLWRFLGLSIAGWGLLWFIIFTLFVIIQFFRKPRQLPNQ